MLDCYHDPYGEKFEAKKKRREFNNLKNTNSFQLWRDRQFKIQNGRCAWCKVDLNKRYIITHIDHITPLRFDGKNEYNNFVLSCRRCNQRKWIANNYTIPQWIKDNDDKLRQEQRLKSMRQKQYRLAKELIDEDILDSLNWI
jgi:5-methylcytosine-specific restriction endonuclease McrA